MTVEFRATPGFDQRFKVDDREMAKATRLLAEGVRAHTPHGATGAAKRSVRADGNRVLSTDPFWHLIEWGSANNTAYAPMRTAVRAAGLRLDESRT